MNRYAKNYIMLIPPFICNVVPVMKLASLLDKYIHADAISLGNPNLDTGIFFKI